MSEHEPDASTFEHEAYAPIVEHDPDVVIVAFDGWRWHVEPPGVEHGYVDAQVSGTEIRVSLQRDGEGWHATELDARPLG